MKNSKHILPLVRGGGFLALLGAVLFYAAPPLLTISTVKVDVDRADWASPQYLATIKSKLGDYKGQSLLQVSLNKISSTLKDDVRIQRVSIQRRIPGQLNVQIHLSEPRAILYDKNKGWRPVTFDGDLLPPLKVGQFIDLPVLRGNEFNDSQDLRKEVVLFLNLIRNAKEFASKNVSEIWWSKKKGYSFFVGEPPMEVVMGLSLEIEKIQDVEKVLRYVYRQQLKGRVIDARFAKKVVVSLRNDI